MTDVQQRTAAKDFVTYWTGRGDEKQETQRFWMDLLRNVYGVAEPEKAIEFECPVKLDHVSFIDGYIKDTVAEMTNFDKTRVFVTRAITQDPALGEGDSQKAVEEVKKTSPEEILQTNAGCVIFSHCGPRTIGILYIDN